MTYISWIDDIKGMNSYGAVVGASGVVEREYSSKVNS